MTMTTTNGKLINAEEKNLSLISSFKNPESNKTNAKLIKKRTTHMFDFDYLILA